MATSCEKVFGRRWLAASLLVPAPQTLARPEHQVSPSKDSAELASC